MVRNHVQFELPSRSKRGFRPPASPGDGDGGLELPEHLEKCVPWWKSVRLLQGPCFWAALAVVATLLTILAVLSRLGWRPGPLGAVLMALGMVVLWRALMTAFAGWVLRNSK